MKTSWNLKDRKAFVTGGSKGIGKATVIEFLELEADVLFSARNEDEIQNLEKELKKEFPNSFIKGIKADVTSKADRQKAFNWIESNFQKLDILVNNAGINIRKSALEYNEEEYRKILEINLIAPFEVSRILYPLLQKSQNASVVNVGSVAGSQDVNSGLPYAMSKGGINQQTRSFAVEWAEDNIRVNTVSPWYTKTPLTEAVFENKEKLERILLRTPLGRIAKAAEMASVIAFLAMDKSSYLTGQNITVDGGMSVSVF
ncbi:SDR family oxidoreductase [Bernardetia sp. ABR2-2B]|uniref:SDR family oxidoreductase n=1 Tax=Bernardetia sp. ABR2-2B TaxID=3127472 RepID=UPI0030D4D42B